MEIRSASLMLVAPDKKLIPVQRNSGLESDDDIAVFCPEMREEHMIDLAFPFNKWDVAAACGQTSDKIVKPIDAQRIIELKLFSFAKGKQAPAGTLVSEPFFVRITQDTFEIKGLPFPDPNERSK